jgi:Outer membrane protein beta-barrel domain
MKRGLVFSFALLAASFVSNRAHAFEREWHTGGGLGFTAYPHYYSLGPSLGLNAGYGISDVFDLKLELLGSYHGYSPSAHSPTEHAEPYSAAFGLSYKLDVLQWIPYAALLVGYQHIAGRLPVGEPLRRDDALAALVLGLDYAMTRNFGLGASLRSDTLLSSPSRGEAVTMLLRAEYHWGF